jgi:hypothetical protein
VDEFKAINEIPKIREFPNMPEQRDVKFNFEDLLKEVKTFIVDTNDFVNSSSDTKKTVNIREYGLHECSDSAKNIFTPKLISEWGNMSYEQQNRVVQEYSKAIAEGLNIDFKGIVFEQMKPTDLGYNRGDGYIYLNDNFLKDSSQIISLIDTVAHEARHQFQQEAIQNPEKFGLDQATVSEWSAGINNYTDKYATEYDPWGYFYNPIEIDARYFGESMVRELTRSLINKC